MDSHLERTISRLGELVSAVGDKLNPLTDADAHAIEKRIKRTLDPAHRELLTQFGASRFEDEVFFEPEKAFPKSYSKSNRGVVDAFLGKINEKYPKAKGISILHKLDILEDDLPGDFLPVADVGAGDLYGMRADGSIWLWIHDARKGNELCFVASSFVEWLDRLHK